MRPGDCDQPEQLQTSLGGVDALVIVPGMALPKESIQQHRNVIDAARAADMKKLVTTGLGRMGLAGASSLESCSCGVKMKGRFRASLT